MSEGKHIKLNQLQRRLPEGILVDAAWLERQGYSSPLLRKYVLSGWLERPTHGVYRRPPGKLADENDDRPRWQHVVISLQTMLRSGLVVGGRTALEAQGFSHYVAPGGSREIHLYGDRKPPAWIHSLGIEQRFVYHNARRLFREGHTPKAAVGLMQMPWGSREWQITYSSTERAMLEMLDEVPGRESFHQADVLMEGIQILGPKRLQALLEACASVKVKRLCLWFAERHNHPWLKRLDLEKIDLGSGKRALVRGGRLDPKYLITVPQDIDARE